MNIDGKAQQLLGEFGQQLKVGDLKFDDEGLCALQVDEAVPINIQYVEDGERFLFYSELGVPVGGTLNYELMLQGNLFWRSTLGATLSLTKDDEPRAVIAIEFDWQSLDPASLEAKFETFTNTVEDWHELLMAEPNSAAEVDGSAPSSGQEWIRP